MAYTFQQSVFNLAFDPIASAVFSQVKWDEIELMVQRIANTDPYREGKRLQAALNRAFPSSGYTTADFIQHQLWCSWREAQWQNGCLTAETVSFHIENKHFCDETNGYPVLLLTPMTVTLSDSVFLIQQLAASYVERAVILYGEGIDAIRGHNPVHEKWIAGDGLQALKRIKKTLSQGGILCTYPDFVYAGHRSFLIPQFFGRQRPVASGFISLACKQHIAEKNTMLLPCMVKREENELVMVFEEPIEIDLLNAHAFSKEQQKAAVAELIGETLEGLIQQVGYQWCLLPTLTYEAPQMAMVK
jgi:hypothetical protein